MVDLFSVAGWARGLICMRGRFRSRFKLFCGGVDVSVFAWSPSSDGGASLWLLLVLSLLAVTPVTSLSATSTALAPSLFAGASVETEDFSSGDTRPRVDSS